MYEHILSALLRKLGEEPAIDQVDPWPGVRNRLPGRQHRGLTPIPRSEQAHTGLAPVNRVLRRRGLPRLAAMAAVAAAALISWSGIGAMQPWNRPTSANAAEVLDGIRTEAFLDSGQ